MNSELSLRIIGEDTSNLFLAFLLLKKGFKVEILKKYNISEKTRQEKLFFISHSTKLIFDKFDLWNLLKEKAYSIESISILDMSILKKIDFSFRDLDFDKQNTNNIGWIFSNFDLDDLFLKEISKFKNVFSSSNIKINSETHNSFNNLLTSNENLNNISFMPFLSKIDMASIEFTASLRGYIDKRYYSIINEYGLFFICPIRNNIFSVKWIIKKALLERVLSYGNSFLLDNLSTILPRELIVDQIFDSFTINSVYSDIFKEISKTDNYLIFKEGSFKSLDFRLEGLNLSFQEVIFIYNQVKNLDFNNKRSHVFFKFKIYILKLLKFKISYIFYELLILNNYFLNFIKRSFFYIFKKVRTLRKLLLKFLF